MHVKVNMLIRMLSKIDVVNMVYVNKIYTLEIWNFFTGIQYANNVPRTMDGPTIGVRPFESTQYPEIFDSTSYQKQRLDARHVLSGNFYWVRQNRPITWECSWSHIVIGIFYRPLSKHSFNFWRFLNLNGFIPSSSWRILRTDLSEIPSFVVSFRDEFLLVVGFRLSRVGK